MRKLKVNRSHMHRLLLVVALHARVGRGVLPEHLDPARNLDDEDALLELAAAKRHEEARAYGKQYIHLNWRNQIDPEEALRVGQRYGISDHYTYAAGERLDVTSDSDVDVCDVAACVAACRIGADQEHACLYDCPPRVRPASSVLPPF